jgi:hypothetical protein
LFSAALFFNARLTRTGFSQMPVFSAFSNGFFLFQKHFRFSKAFYVFYPGKITDPAGFFFFAGFSRRKTRTPT